MSGFIELIAKIKPKNNGKYALVDDVDVEMEDGSRLSEAIKKPRIPDGGTEGQILAKKSNTNGDVEWVEPLKTEDIDKKLESKLDKNLGSENSDKVLTTDSQGNIITQNKEDFEGGGGTTNYDDLENKPQINGVELKGNKTSSDLKMYTQEEVDDLLYDKMDKPYKPITITDDITIEDCLDGHFKINKILGNTYQAEESDIVPTPQRPVPINSRKTLVTKTNPNVFDLGKESDTSNIPDTGTYRSVGQHQLKANTKYVFSWSGATVPAKATLSFQIHDDKGTVLVSPFTYFNLESNEKEESGKEVEFTTNESGIIKFAYNCTVGTSNTKETYQQYWYTKILKNIALKEDVEYEPEYVELRSLKESKNLFDNRLFTLLNPDYFTLNDDGTGIKVIREEDRSIENIQYEISIHSLFYCHFMCSGGLIITIYCLEDGQDEWRMVQICNDDTTDVTFSVGNNNPAKLKFEIHSSISTETANIALYSYGIVDETKYVPATIRDYKIVDHANKTSKIIRNVGLYVDDKTGDSWTTYDNQTFQNSYFKNIKNMKRSNRILSYSNSFEVVDEHTGVGNTNSMWIGVTNSNVFVIKTDFKTIEEWKTWLKNNDLEFLYPLVTPVEETITYVETDTSEVGYSWQDTTSPSPTIKSEVQSVEEIDILKTGKNLLNETLAKDYTNYINLGNGYSKFVVNVKPNTKYTVSRKDDKGAKLNNYMYVQGTQVMWMIHTNSNNVNVKQVTLTSTENGTLEVTFAGIDQTKLNEVWDILGYLQIELGDTATAYEPYKGQHINITLSQPLYQDDVANVESGDYEYEKQKYVVTGDEVFIQDYQNKSGYYGGYFNLKNGMGLLTDKVFCNCLNYVQSVWNSESEGVCQNSNKQIHLKFSNDRLCITDNTPVEEKRLAFANYLKQLYASEEPLYVVVKVAKTTQPILEEDLAKLKSLKTSAGVNNIFINGEVKPAIEAMYPQDVVSTVNKLQTKLLTLQEEVIKNV